MNPKYRLVRNAYLTCIDERECCFNRRFTAGTVFEKVGRETIDGRKMHVLGLDECQVYVSDERLREAFELTWDEFARVQ